MRFGEVAQVQLRWTTSIHVLIPRLTNIFVDRCGQRFQRHDIVVGLCDPHMDESDSAYTMNTCEAQVGNWPLEALNRTLVSGLGFLTTPFTDARCH